jgi:hypothetical protein
MREEPEGFKEFWEQVWRPHARHTDGRGLAREAFARHIKAGACPQDIIDGARYFFRTMKERDKEFVPLSATWLNRGAYEDMAEAERALQQRVEQRQQAANVVELKPQQQESPERRAEMAARLREVAAGMRAPS